MTKPDQNQIDFEVLWLEVNKSKIRRRTGFGNNNRAAIDAQIEVLKNGWTESEVLEKAEENEWWFFERENALDAARWMEGEKDLRPSAKDNWGGWAN